MIDNFKNFPWEFKKWEFYYVQIIERAKDNPHKKWLNGWNSCRVLKSYSISSQSELNKRIPLIKEYCEKYKARCYIHPSRRSNIDIAHQMVIMLWEYLLKNNHNLSRLFDSACWINTWVEKMWIIDIDKKDFTFVDNIVNTIIDWSLNKKELKIYCLSTVNWFHIITTPFDVRILNGFNDFEIKKNNPTLLYFNA